MAAVQLADDVLSKAPHVLTNGARGATFRSGEKQCASGGDGHTRVVGGTRIALMQT